MRNGKYPKNLAPIDLETAFEMNLAPTENELAAVSLEAYKYRIRHLLQWCNREGILIINTLTRRQVPDPRVLEQHYHRGTEAEKMDQLGEEPTDLSTVPTPNYSVTVDGIRRNRERRTLTNTTMGL